MGGSSSEEEEEGDDEGEDDDDKQGNSLTIRPNRAALPPSARAAAAAGRQGDSSLGPIVEDYSDLVAGVVDAETEDVFAQRVSSFKVRSLAAHPAISGLKNLDSMC